MEKAAAPSFQKLSIHATIDELQSGTFQMPADEIRHPILELTFFVEVKGRRTETRTRVSAEFVEVAADWKRYTGRNVLSSISKIPSFDA
jgi:hypothetical protein